MQVFLLRILVLEHINSIRFNWVNPSVILPRIVFKRYPFRLFKSFLDGGQIDRTEVSMSDLIHCGGQTGTHEMDFTKKLRERREAKVRN